MTYDDVDWMEVDDHGATSGNGYVTHTCQGAYKGRVQRTGHTTITTDEETPKTATINFIQLPKTEYVTFDSASYQATASGGQVTLTGKTNSPRLGFSKSADAGNMATLPDYFSINGGAANQDVSGQVFAGDPGASGEIAFTIVVTIAANTTMSSRSCTIQATGSTGVTGTANIIQAAASSYLYVDQMGTTTKTITFDSEGLCDGEDSVDVDVLSNDDWQVSVSE